jgi:DNA-binding CsgD family transcriptional regulator
MEFHPAFPWRIGGRDLALPSRLQHCFELVAQRAQASRPETATRGGRAHVARNLAGKDQRLGWRYEQIGQFDHVDRSLTLLLLDGCSYREMAETLGISENYVGVKINRIKTHLINLTKEEQHHGV